MSEFAAPDGIRIERLGPGDDGRVMAAAHLSDDPPSPEATVRFLGRPEHHLLLASAGDEPAGVTGVEMTRPDKGTEMFLYELGVDEAFQRRGSGRALVVARGASHASAAAPGCGC